VARNFKNRPQPTPEADSDSERRRVGAVEHDDRGNAFVSWRDAPADEERQVLEILGQSKAPLAIKSDNSYDPYARGKAAAPNKRPKAQRTDLRKLSEHIRKMRELEERKKADEDSED
jgi:hypothetical protein